MTQFNPRFPRPHLHSPRAGVDTQAATSPEEGIGAPALFLLGVIFGTLILVAVVTNGPGAGSQHHHFVRYLLTGLFVGGGGLVGLVITTATCGRLGLYEDETAEAGTESEASAAFSIQMDTQLNRQHDHYLRRLHNSSVSPKPETPGTRPAPRAVVSKPLDATSPPAAETGGPADADSGPTSAYGNSASDQTARHLRRRRNRRA